MNRGNKQALCTIIAGAIAFFIGFYIIGIAKVEHVTSKGVVDIDMTNAQEVYHAMQDPSFTTLYIWGDFTLQGAWGLAIPLVLVIIGISLVTFIFRRKLRSKK